MGEILRAENISKTYQAGRVVVKALNRCSFTVERGEFVAVVGRSGSGKSTLLRILASFDKPDEGKVYVEGEDISCPGCPKSLLKRAAALQHETIGPG